MSVTSIKVGSLYWTKFDTGMFISETFLSENKKYVGLCLKTYNHSSELRAIFLINKELIQVYQHEILEEIQ